MFVYDYSVALVVRSFPGRAQIRSLTKKIEDRERAAAKVEKSMKVARVGSIDTRGANWLLTVTIISFQDNWQPALQDLVTSIGKRFSEAFDRESSHFLVQNPVPGTVFRHRMCWRAAAYAT
jgi:hypothetical protein